ncbi:cell wall / vacuolar inhibitor of fructosidase 2-like [Papaver somniferum]|uniref:cell wall / vacuolar inhibitor of fructosidase 2-like n=1 Tax=Papaver somniferum TaxID=3469 RepID=UPI000E704DF6|nr:cell wall / vacuolar inhibitor of fructosidase 2-like [Papaver somniferum]
MGNCNHNFVFVLPLIIIISLFNSTAGEQSNKQVDSVCNQTPNPKFCVDAIYTDPSASDANIVALAYISFRLASTNATNTLSFITDHHNPNNGSHGVTQEEGLKQCSLDYQKAENALEAALADLDSDTYELGQYAAVAAQSAVHCEHSLNATKMISSSLHSELTRRNTDLKLLAGICSVISSMLVT